MENTKDYLEELENEAIYIIREAFAQGQKHVLLFSGGKDSIVLLHLAMKAFWPMSLPFPLLHIDTGHNFEETIEFRDKLIEKLNLTLIVRYVEDSILQGKAKEEIGLNTSRNALQTVTLLDSINEFNFDMVFGGARRDEEKARAKERIFSHRNDFGQWNPKNQRPELWSLYNCKKIKGEHFRVFPLSNWTEHDIWNYIKSEGLEIPEIYFSHKRTVFNRNGSLLAHSPFVSLSASEMPEEKNVRFRTVGDITCTGAFESDANTIDDIIDEIKVSRLTERSSRVDDKKSDVAMEERKIQGYF